MFFTDGQQACIDQDGTSAFALCANGSWVLTKCAGGLQCFALPLVAKPGTSVTCDTQDNALSRIADTGATVLVTANALRLLAFDPSREGRA